MTGGVSRKKMQQARDNVTPETVEHEKKQEKVLENRRHLIKYEESVMLRKLNISNGPAELRRRAEARRPVQRKGQRSKARHQKSAADTQRALHELEVHQIVERPL